MIIVPDTSGYHGASFKRAREKSKKACLEGLKCLNKELLVALPEKLIFLWSCFYQMYVNNVS